MRTLDAGAEQWQALVAERWAAEVAAEERRAHGCLPGGVGLHHLRSATAERGRQVLHALACFVGR